ncbi:MAG: class I SAM-dependent methyltransferase [Actinomycetota bacterium]
MRTDPRPTPESIGAYYPDDYGPYLGTRVDEPEPVAPRPAWKRRLLGLIDLRTEFLPPLAPGRMLEIGCASGSFLNRMSSRGWEVEGIEPSATAAGRARSLGFSVQTASLESAVPPARPVDLAVGWMVLEHLHDPITALQKLRGWVKPGGWLVGSTPDAGTWQLRAFGGAWYSLSLPHHLFHYTPSTLAVVLDHAGWKLERLVHQRLVSDPVASLGYLLQDRGRAPRLASRLTGYPTRPGRQHLFAYPLALVLAALRRTGRMTFWARPAR